MAQRKIHTYHPNGTIDIQTVQIPDEDDRRDRITARLAQLPAELNALQGDINSAANVAQLKIATAKLARMVQWMVRQQIQAYDAAEDL